MSRNEKSYKFSKSDLGISFENNLSNDVSQVLSTNCHQSKFQEPLMKYLQKWMDKFKNIESTRDLIGSINDLIMTY